MKKGALFPIALAFAVAAAGQTAAGSPPAVHEDVVVADRAPDPPDDAPAAVSTLTREQIAALPVSNLGEAIRYLPGFEMYLASGPGGTPPMLTARGFFGGGQAEYVQVRIDGIPIGDADSGIVDWRAIPAAAIDRIEAVRGAASPLYGDTALAGVIDVFTRAGATGSGGLAASLSAGSFGSASAAASGTAAENRLAFDGSASRTDGFRQHAGENDESLDLAWRTPSALGLWGVRLTGTSKRRDDPGQLSWDEARADPDRSDPLFRFDREATDRLRAEFSLEDTQGPVPFRAAVYGVDRRTDLVQTLLAAPGLGETAAQELRSESAGLILDGRWSRAVAHGELRFRGGAEASRDFVDSIYRSVDADGNPGDRDGVARGMRDRTGVFAAGDWDALARLRLTAGMRWDRIADDLSEPRIAARHEAWSPQGGLVWFLGDRASGPPSIFVQYSRAFKAATFDQQFDPRPFSDFQGGSFTISNPELQPQRARMLEGGVRIPASRGRLEATAYRIDVDDEIDFDPATFRYVNIGRSRHVGIESQLAWSLTSALSAFAGYDWTRVESRGDADAGNQLKNIPEHVVRAGGRAELPGSLSLEAVWTWTGRRWLDDADQFRLPDVSVFDVRLARDLGEFRLHLDVLNAGNARYADVGFTLADFQGNEKPFVYPAAGRSFRVGLDWRR